MNLTTILRTAKAALTSISISNLATKTSSSRKPRFFTSTLLVLSFVFSLLRVESGWGQTNLIPIVDGTFENATVAFTNNGWIQVGTSSRTWRVGGYGNASTGINAAYWGTTTAYGGSASAAVGHFYRDIVIPVGATNVFLNYKLKYPTVDNTFDYFYVFTTTTANTPANGTVPTTGYTQQFVNTANTYANFTAMPQINLTSLAGTTVRIVFTFKCDAATPNAAPAVDDITLSYLLPCSGTPVVGQTSAWSPVAVTGYNADVVANGVGAASSSATQFDLGGYGLVSADFQAVAGNAAPTYSLPTNGIVNSTTNAGINYQMADYSSNNSLRLITGATTGTLTLTSGTTAKRLALLVSSGNGTSTFTAQVNFSDGTNQQFTGNNVNDWYGSFFSIGPIGRITLSSSALDMANTTAPGLYDVILTLAAGNQTKTISSILFTKTDAVASALNIMGVSLLTNTPSSVVCNGQSRILSLPDLNLGSGHSFQWQTSTSSTGPWSTITGATSSTYTTPALTSTGFVYYQCIVTCSSNSATSSPIGLTVNNASSITPASGSICSGASLQASPSSNATYLWSNNATTSSISVTAAGTYSVLLSNNGCVSKPSASITLTANNTATLTSAVGTNAQSLCQNVAITNITYSTTGATGIANAGISGGNGLPPGVSATWVGNVLTISGTPTATGNYSYSILMTGGCGSISVTGNINVTAAPTLNGVSQPSALCYNTLNGSTSTSINLSGLIASTAQTATYNINGGTSQTVSFTSSATGTATISIPLVPANNGQTLTFTSINCSNFNANNSCVLAVNLCPYLTVGTMSAFANQCVGTTSSALSFVLSGINLVGDVSLAALPGFTYSLSSTGTYTNTLIIPVTPPTLGNTTVYVKFTPVLAQLYSGNIVATSSGASNVSVAASGTGVAPPALTSVTASPSTICLGNLSTLTAVATPSNAVISWYSAPTGGTILNANMANNGTYLVSPTTTTTYYAEAQYQPNTQTINYTGSIVNWTVPAGVTSINIDARGASGGYKTGYTAGKGAKMVGDFTVTPGQVLSILVGQSPGLTTLYPAGGGGTFVADGANYTTATPLIVAGGGGGANSATGIDAPTTTSGTGTTPGTNGNGAPANSCTGGGGGFYTSGGNDLLYSFTGGAGFRQGGAGGAPTSAYTGSYQSGGFGGGAPANYVGSCNTTAGNGGGYSGGSANGTGSQSFGNAGGSFNGGANQVNSAGFNTGNGQVIITWSNDLTVQGCISPRTGVTVTVGPAVPSQPSVITGSTIPDIGSTQTYSVTAVGGVTYTWSFPSTWTIQSGQGTNVVTVTVGTQNGTISVVPSISCGSGPARTLVTAIPQYRWKYVSSNLGNSYWCPGETRNVTINIMNNGSANWADVTGVADYNIGIKWNGDGTNWLDYYFRVDAQSLQPGQTGTFTFNISAKNSTSTNTYTTNLATGVNNLIFDIVRENCFWFSSNSTACSVTASGNTVFTSPAQSISYPSISSTGITSTVCSSSSVQTVALPYTSVTGAPISYSIAWTGMANQSSTPFAFTATGGTITSIQVPGGTAPGTYTGVMTIQNVVGCSVTQSISLTVVPVPTLSSVTQPTSLCYNTVNNSNVSILLQGLVPSLLQNATYTMGSATSQISFTSNSSGQATLSIPVTMANNGQTLSITSINCSNFTTNNSCVLSIIQSPASPTVSPSSLTVNVGASATFTASLISSSNSLKWWTAALGGNQLDPDVTTPGLDDAVFNSYQAQVNPPNPNNTPSPNVAFCTPGTTYTYYVEEFDGTCPSARTLVQVLTNPLVSSSSSNNLICQTGASVTLTANITQASTGSSIQWMSNTNSTGSFNNVSTSNPVTFQPAISTLYQLNTSLLMPFGCTSSNFNSTLVSPASTQQSILVYPSLDFVPYANPSSICIGGTTSLIPNTPSGNFTASCINPVSFLSTPPSSAVTLFSGGSVQTLPTGLAQGSSGVDDNFISGVPIGFNYNFFGQTASTVFVGTNGTVTVNVAGAVGSSSYSFPGGFPNTTNPASTIAVCARDLNLTSGTIKYWTEGFSPTRRFIVQYANCPEYSGTGTQSAELVLYETSGIIDIRVIQATNNTTWAASLSKYIGLQDASKTIGATAPNCNSNNVTLSQNYWNGITNQITSPLAWRFAPPANYNIKWYLGTGNSASLVANLPYVSGAASSIYNYSTLSSQSQNPGQVSYTVSATNTNTNCPSSQTLAITVNALPVAPNSGGNVTACSNATTTTLSAIAPSGCTIDWYSNINGTGTPLASGTSNYSFAPSSVAGVYTYYAFSRNTSTGCMSANGTAILLTVYQAPAPPVSATTAFTYCEGANATQLTATPLSGNTLNWYSGTLGSTPSSTAPTPSTATNSGSPFTFYATQVSGTNGCQSNATTFTVTVNNTPAAPVLAATSATSGFSINPQGTISYCQGATTYPLWATGLSSNLLNNPGSSQQYWYYTSPTGSGGQTSTSPIPSSATAGAMTYYVSRQNTTTLCEGARTPLIVVINPSLTPVVAISATSTSVCSGGAITFTATPTNGGPTPTYQWYLNGSVVSGQTTPTYTLANPNVGDAIYVTMVSNEPSCLFTPNATSATVTLSNGAASPSVSIIQSTGSTICAGTAVTFSVLSSANMGGTPTYSWKVNGVNVGLGSSYTTTSLVNSDLVTLNMTSSLSSSCINGNGTAISNGISMTVTPATAISAQPVNAAVCLGGAQSLSVTAVGTGTITYQWKSAATSAGPFTNIPFASNSSSQSSTLSIPSVSGQLSYQLVASSSCGTATSSVATISINQATAITAQPQAIVACQGTSATFTVTAIGTGVVSYQWRYNGVPISGATSSTYTIPSLSLSSPGQYSVVVSASCGSVTSSNAQLTVNPLTTISNQPTGVSICDSNAFSLSVTASGTAPITYQWYRGATAISGATSALYSDLNGVVSESGNYTVVVTGGCSNVTSSVATVLINPNTWITAQPQTYAGCALNPTSLSVTGLGANLQYQWNLGSNPSNPITGATNSTLSFSNPQTSNSGSYSVTLTGVCGTQTSNIALVTINPVPSAGTIIGGNSGVCVGSSINLTNLASGGVWSTSNSALANISSTGVLTGVSAGSITVTYTVTNSFGCVSVATKIIQVKGLPSAVIQTPLATSICQGESMNLLASAAVSYMWSNGATTQSTSVNSSATGTSNYSVSVTGTNGCTASSAPLAITVIPVPTIASISGSGNFPNLCLGNATNLSNATPNGLWSSNNTTVMTVNPNTGSANALAIGTATISYHVANIPGCLNPNPGTATVSITVSTPPSAYITPSGSTTFCSGGSVILSAPIGAGYNYLWSNGSTSQSITVSTSGTLTVTVTAAGGCSVTSLPTTVNVLPIPTATIYPTGAINICSGTNVTLSTGSAVSYLWSNGVNTPTISVNTAGTYSVTLTGTNGCTATSAVSTVTVTPVPSAVITANGPTNICDGGSVGLSVPTAQSYLWSNGATTQAITATSTGNYSVTATNGICSATSTPTFVNFNPVPSSVITASGPTTFCQGGNVSLSAPNGNSYTYLWTNGATSQSITVSNTGVYGVTVSNSFGCSSTSIPVSVIVNSLPVASITAAGSTTICSGSFVNLSAPAGGTYLWSNGATTQFINAASAGNYTVTVSTLAGCSATSTPTTISVNALPSAAISSNGSTTFCQGGNVGLTANNGMSAYLWSNGNTGQSISATSSGSYSVQVTDANGCSANSNVISVVVNQAPIATIYPGTNVTICSGSSVTLSTNSASSYTWSNGSHSPTVQVNTSGLYSVTLTGSNGCSATSSVTTVAVTTTPTAAITASGPTTICQGSNVNLSAPAAANTYLWNTGATTQSINVSLVGSYYVTVGSNGCSATSPSTFVSYNPVPSAAVTASGPTTFCQGNSVTFSAPAGNGNTYVWNTGATTQSVSTSTAGNFSVTVTNGYGCSATSTTSSVLINPLPVVTPITGSSSICAGTQGQVSNVMTGGVYASSNLGVASIGQLSGQITGLTAGTTTISYVYTNANGCSNTVTYPVNIIAAPVATITAGGPTTFCQGGSVLLTASSGTSYVWNTGETTATITATTAGNYSVTVTGANGCSATSLATTVNILTPSPVSAINGASAVCVNSATALTNASSGGVWTSSTPAVATISAAGIVTGVSAGTTTISYTINSTNGCQNTTTKVVTVNAVPSTALTASGATTFCQGGNVQLTASAGATYAWNNGATTSSITATTAGTYNVTVTNANGCSSVSTNQTITVNALPIAQISTNGSTNLCTGGSITLMATPSASYLWSTGATTSSITTSTAGTYTVAVTNANGCSATSTATNVAVNASPSATVTASGPTTICSGNNVVLTATSVVGNTYQWMKNGVLIPGATLNVYTATTSGSYSLLVTNASGCSSTSAITAITVNAAPVANITAGGATTFCSGGSVTLTASAGTSYLWSTGATTASIIATTAGSRTVTVTNAAGCSTTSAPINIVVNTMPTATITAGGPTSICSGSNVTLTASGGSTYVWNNGATTASIVANTSGNYSVTVYNANGCSAISTPTTVTVNNPSVANVSTSGPTTFCQGGSVNLTATTAASYAWSNGATTQSISVNTSGNYSVVLTNASGCTSTSPVIAVTANALPTATITAGGSTTFCQGGSVTLTASPATSYLWSNGATGSSINVTTAGNYTVQIANNSGCTANSAATTVTVNALPVATITAGGSLSICAGSSVNLTASTGTAYLWSNGATTATIAASNAGNYTVQVSNAAGCTSTSSVSSVIVNALPTPSITSVGSTTICQGASVTLTTANGSGLTYQWKNNGTNISGATAASYVASTAGNYTVQMTNAAGCSGTSTATTVTVNALPVASISNSGSNTICSGSSVNLTASTGTTYAWSNGATTATIALNATGNYSVIVTNAAGCTNSAATTITVVTPTVASISANGPTYFCTGQNVVLTANTGASYLWSTGATTASITVAATSNISVQVTYASGCVSTSPITAVNVNALPVASITASGATSFCPGSSVTLTASNGSSYVWTNGATTNSIVVSSAGSYGVTVANAAGCSSVAAPTSIVVFAAPTATITPSAATTFCQGASINLTANAAAGYAWSNGASTSSISVNNSGNFTVTVTDANGCSAISSVVPVTVNAVPVASIQANGPTTVCQGTSVVLTANGGTGFAWSNSETTASITVNATGSYGVTVTNAAGCSSVVTPVSITVNPVQILSPIVGATNVCVGSSTTYTNSTSGGTWSSDNTAVAAVNATNGIVSGISTGSATIKYQFVNASGCTSEVTKVVTVNGIQPVSIAASGSTTFCQGGTVTLTAPAGLNYNWTNGATTQSITVNASGIYGITASNVAGCSTTSSTVAVTVNPAPVASISSTSTALCQGSNLVLNAPANAATYAWSNGATTQNVLITAPGVYSLTLTDANGCSASASTTIVNGINPVATIAAGGATTFCSGGSVVLNAAGGTSFLWNNGATTQNITVNTPGNYSVMVTNAAGCSAMSNATMVNVLQSPNAVATAYGPTTFCQGGSVTIATSGGATYAWSNGSTAQSILPTTSGTYSVVVTAVNGCTATSNPINVTVNPTPTAVITPSGTTTFCEGSSVNLVASGGSNYAWSNGPNTSSITITTGGTYTVTVTNAGGCTDTETISVTVNEVPSAFIVTSGATTFCQGGQVNLTAQAGNSYLWSNNATTQSISVASAGTYSVTIQSPNGCSVSSNAISVTVNQPSASSLNATAFDSYTLNGILYTQSGTYTQNLTNAAGCDSTITLNLTLTVGIEEGTLTDVNVYPNPTSESFTIKTTVPVYGVYSVVDAQGKLIFEGELTGTETQINISSVARGIYYLRIPELSEPLRVVKN